MTTQQTIDALRHPYHAVRVRIGPAVAAGISAALVFILLYYATLSLLPPAFAYPRTTFPVAAWAHRFDLAQFFGSFLIPPYPTPVTWCVGLAVLFGSLAASGLVYAVLLAWGLRNSSPKTGIGFGVLLFIGLALAISFGSGMHPAVMRSALADTGFLLIGWSHWATLQLLALCLAFGGVLDAVYRQSAAHAG